MGPGAEGDRPSGLAPAQDYRLTPADETWQESTPAVKRFEANVDAVRRAKEVQAGRPLTEEDRAAFARFSGMGDSAFNDAFPMSRAQNPNPRLVALGQQLRDILGQDEYESLGTSRINAFFTNPSIVTHMWDALRKLGIDSLPNLKVLEPAAGSGRFLSLMPPDLHDRASITAAEQDLMTGEMLRSLFPEANVLVMPFQRIDVQAPGAVPDGSQDIVISNVPFGKVKVADPRYADQPGLTSAVHNYFFVKALDKVRPGGVVAFITSHQTFDAASEGRTDFRRYLADRAELLGAVRLPQGAFPDTAVTTDILFFRKNEVSGAQGHANPEWIHTEQRSYPDERGEQIPVSINKYFINHPEMALGEHAASRHTTDGQKSGYVLKADKSKPIGTQLSAALAHLPEHVIAPRPTYVAPSEATLAASKAVDGSFVEGQDGKLKSFTDGKLQPAGRYVERGSGAHKTSTWTPYSEKEVARIRAMVAIHDFGRSVLDLQRAGAPDNETKLAQAKLRQAYDAFVRQNGPLHSGSNRSIISDDPRSYWLQSLEKWGKELEARFSGGQERLRKEPVTASDLNALRSDIFSKNLQSAGRQVTFANTPKDALMVALNERGTLDFARMTELLGRPATEIAADLHRDALIYRNPALKGEWQLADEYLSGKVKQKLAAAQKAARKDPAYQPNVAALEKVQPRDLEPGEIDVRLGTAWIPEGDVNQFIRETLFKPSYQGAPESGAGPRNSLRPFHLVRTGDSATWHSTQDAYQHHDFRVDPAKAQEFGTDRISPLEIAEHAMNAQAIRIMDYNGRDEPPTFNEEATRAANGKLRALKAAFENWIWSDPERAARLAKLYNDTFNDTVLRTFDGSHLIFADANPNIVLRPHQKAAVWRIITNPSTLLAHEVGYGKSMTMAAAAMEMKRLGLSKRTVIVVPNHLVGQMAREFYKLYPQANLLVPGKADFAPAARATLMSRIATGDWDSVIVPVSQFKLLPVHPQTALRFAKELAKEIQAVIAAYIESVGRVDKSDRTYKDLKKREENAKADVQRAIDKAQAYQAEHKHSLTWDELGVDALMVDEADQFKNLQFFTTRSRIKGLPNSKSDRAFDMHMKTRMLLEQRGRGLVFATGTPISNTIAELWTMLRYLAPKTLDDLGISAFDAWASAFGDTVEKMEQTLTGERKPVTRFARFGNAPELSNIFQRVADIRMAEDSPEMEAKKPQLRGGERIKVKSLATPWHKAYAKSLDGRAKSLKGMPEKGGDNMLKITGDARKASLDPQLVGGPPLEDGKINQLVDNVVRVYQREAADKGTQLVFLDMGTPKDSQGLDTKKLPKELRDEIAKEKAERGDEWDEADQDALIGRYYALHDDLVDPHEQQQIEDVYNRIREQLVARGIPRNEVMFIHQAKNDEQRGTLFDLVNNGEVRVLIGSTEKMGAGTNVQERVAALHHLDTPWRPRDLEQREGRALRPGNKVYGPPTDEHGEPLKDAHGNYRQGRGVEVYQYVTEWPFDGYLWSTLLSKIRAIKSMMRRNVTDRSVLDADEHILDMEELEALANGDPIAIKQLGVQEELRQLEAELRDHQNRQAKAASELKRIPAQIEDLKRVIEQSRADAKLRDSAPSGFKITIDGKSFDKRSEAGDALVDAIKRATDKSEDWEPVGSFKGFTIQARESSAAFLVRMLNPQNIEPPMTYSTSMAKADLSPQGIVQRLENLPKQIEPPYFEGKLRDVIDQQQGYQTFLKQPYTGSARIEQLRDALKLIEQRLAEPKTDDHGEPRQPTITDEQIAKALDGAPPARNPEIPPAPNPPAEEREIAQADTGVDLEPAATEDAPVLEAEPTAEAPLVSEGQSDENAPPRSPRARREKAPSPRSSAVEQPALNGSAEGSTPPAGTPEAAPAVEAPESVAAAETPSAEAEHAEEAASAVPEAEAAPEAKYEYQSTQANLPSELANKLVRYQVGIATDDLANGLASLESQPHVTVKYGLHTGVNLEDVQRILANEPPISVTFGSNATFPAGEDGAPLYITVDSPDLHRIHGMLKAVLPNTETHDSYTPHVTIAYLKPEAVDKYTGEASPLAGTSTTLGSIAFSDNSGNQVEIPLVGRLLQALRKNGRTNGHTHRANGLSKPTEPLKETEPILSNGSGNGKPPIEPPAPPQPPTPEEPERQHVVGYGYQSGMSPEVEQATRDAADAFKPERISQADVARAAKILGLDEASTRALRDAALSDEKQISVASQALRYRARAAVEAVQAFDRLHAQAYAKQQAGLELSQDEKESLDDSIRATLLAAAHMDLKGSRMETADIARALAQHQFIVTAQGAREAYQRLDQAAASVAEATQVLEHANGRDLTPAEQIKVAVAAEQLEQMADAAAAADHAEERMAAGPSNGTAEQLVESGLSRSTAEAVADRPLLEQKALQLVQLTPEWKAARAAGEWDRVDQIEQQRGALIHEMDSMLADEEAERQAQPAREPKERAPIDVEASAARGVIGKMRREIRERLRDPEAGRDETLARINDQIRQLVLEQEVSGKDLVPKAARLAEMNRQQANARDRGDYARSGRIEQERVKLLNEIRDEVDRQVREKIARGPRKFTTGAELEQAVREAIGKGIVGQIRRAIDEQLHPEREAGKLGEQIARRVRTELERATLQGLAKTLRELSSSPFRQGTTARTIQGIHETIQQLEATSAAGKARASEIRRALVKAGLFRYLERRDVPEHRLDDFITMVMTADPDRPEQIAAVLRALRQPTVWDKLREYTIINMLSSPLTWGFTGVSVLSHLLIGSGRILVATPLNALHDALRYGGKNISIGELPAALGGVRATLPESARLYGQIVKHGFTPDAVQSAVELVDLGALRREYLSEGKRFGWLWQWMHRISTRPVEAAYASMGHTLYGAMIHSLAYREARKLLRDGTRTGISQDDLQAEILRNLWDYPHIVKQAGAIEDYSLLRSKLDRISAAISSVRHAPPGSSGLRQAGAFAFHQLFPFMVAPINFAKMGMGASALGLPVHAYQYGRSKDPFEQAEQFHKLLIGSLIFGIALALLSGDNLSGDGPTDPSKRRVWLATHQRDSVRLAGNWVSYDGTYFAIPLGMVANAYESAQEQATRADKSPSGDQFLNVLAATLGGAAKGTLQTMASQSFVRTLGDFSDMLAGRQSPSLFLSSQLSKLVPLSAMLALFARMGDSVQRDTHTFTEQLADRVPGARGANPPALNPLGSPEANDQQGLAGLLPFRPASRPDQNNPVIREYERLNVSLPPAPSNVRSVPLTESEQHDYEAEVGPKVEAAAGKLIASAGYAKLNDVARAKVLKQIVDKLRLNEEALALKRIGAAEIKRRLALTKKAA